MQSDALPSAFPPSRDVIDAVLDAWFGHIAAWRDPATTISIEVCMRWFGQAPPEVRAEMDRKCERFRPLVLRLSELDIATIAPHATTDRDAALAFCLLLDQMPRNLYRQDTDPEGLGRICFGRTDPLARALVKQHLVPKGLDVAYGRDHMTSRTFFILPLGHSEDLADQKQAMVLTEDVKEHAPPAMQELAGLQLHAARQHIELIERFGRFPHRNGPLGRTDTEAEAAWRKETGGRPFG